LPTAASHGGIELGGARELTGTRITLTDRDRVVLRLFSDDVPAKVIAEEAGLSPRQVYGHLQRLCDTLDDRLGGFARHSIPGFTSAAPDVPESRVARIAAARARREAEAKPKRARKTLATKGGTSGPKAHVAPKPAKKAKSKGRAKGRAKGPAKK
jgi:DNA-binding CsgD family transcriptional regulator